MFLNKKLSVNSDVSWFLFLPFSIFENMDSFHKLIFRGMDWSDLEYFSKHSVCLRQNSQGIAQNYQCKPSNEA